MNVSVKKIIYVIIYVINVWNMLERKTVGNYHNIYLKTDVLLWADAFQKFFSTRLKYYGLDPCHYFSSPGLSW